MNPLRHSPLSDAETAARIRAGDIAVFQRVFEAYDEPLTRFAVRYLRSMDAAREAVQDAFVRMWDQRETLAIRDTMRGYLYRIVRNVCVDELRRREREVRKDQRAMEHVAALPDEIPAMGRPVLSAHESLEIYERRQAIWNAVNRLPERRRLIMLLRWQHQLPNAEIAEILGISVKGVEGHVTRALAWLASELDEFTS